MSKVWNVELGGGVKIPVLGLGTYKAQGDDIRQSINAALDLGYRHFDTADYYKNLKPMGEILNEAITAKKVTRDELFITTKIWPTFYGSGCVLESIKRMLSEVQLDHFDQVLLHWPFSFANSDTELMPLDEKDQVRPGDSNIADVYRELEQAQTSGLTRSIGISNFNSAQVEELLKTAVIKPVLNQVECHVYFGQKRLRNFCKERGILITAYCPLGNAGTRPNTPNILLDETLVKIAERHGKSTAQVSLRWLIQQQIVAIPKSVRRERLQQNIDLFDFELSGEEMTAIDGLDRNLRYVKFNVNGVDKLERYPFGLDF